MVTFVNFSLSKPAQIQNKSGKHSTHLPTYVSYINSQPQFPFPRTVKEKNHVSQSVRLAISSGTRYKTNLQQGN